MLKEIIKKIQINGKTSFVHGLKDIIFLVPMPSKATYGFNVISIKMQMAFFAEIEKFILKFIWNLKRPQAAKTIIKKAKL